jgi:hypothetical protein
MIQYTVTKPLEIGKGQIIELSQEQVVPRLHNLKPHKKGKYEVKAAISFKAGEVIGLDPFTVKVFGDALKPVKA